MFLASGDSFGKSHLKSDFQQLFLKMLTILLIIAQLWVCAHCDDNCLRCQDFNRDNKMSCASSWTDCGKCKSGYIEDEEDPRICYTLEILESPESVDKNLNTNVYLKCKFNGNIKCNWTKDGKTMDIVSPNYKWSNSRNGSDTDDCSINIMNLSSKDSGEWICSNVADSSHDPIQSEPAVVHAKSNVKVGPKGTLEVSEGEAVAIPCFFDHAEKCGWTKMTNPIKSNENYQFKEMGGDGDCSLIIKSINLKTDVGNWTCSIPGNSHSTGLVAGTIELRSALQPIAFSEAREYQNVEMTPNAMKSETSFNFSAFGNIETVLIISIVFLAIIAISNVGLLLGFYWYKQKKHEKKKARESSETLLPPA